MDSKRDVKMISVTVVVPVFNRESYLNRCLDSLINQTLESIEIILVDDFSTDDSWAIMLSYAQRFPDKVSAFHNDKKGVAHARNLAIKKAKGEYVAFVDSDDYVEYWAFDKAFKHAKESDCEVQVSPFYKVLEENCEVHAGFVPDSTKETMIKNLTPYMCSKLFRRDVFDRFGYVPDLWVGDDAAFVYTVFSYVEEIDYFPTPYYYFLLNDTSVSVQMHDRRMIEHGILSSMYILEHCNPDCHVWMRAAVLHRLLNIMEARWLFLDEFIEHIKTNADMYNDNPVFECWYPAHAQKLKELLELSDKPLPCRVYINAFGGKPSNNFIEEVRQKAFWAGAEVVLLDQSTCDIHENSLVEQAYMADDFEFVTGYFAVRQIYNHGGVYIAPCIKIDAALNYLRYNPSFFGYLDDSSFSDKIFGGMQGNPILGAILDSYNHPDLYENPFEPLAHRIKTILIAKSGVPLKALTRRSHAGVIVYDIGTFVVNMGGFPHFCTHNFDICANGEESMVLPSRVYRAVLEKKDREKADAISKINETISRRSRDIKYLKTRNEKLNKTIMEKSLEINQLKIWNENLRTRLSKTNEAIKIMEQSISWKITKPFRVVLKAIGKLLH